MPPPSEMESDEGSALREWRRLDLIWNSDLDLVLLLSEKKLSKVDSFSREDDDESVKLVSSFDLDA